MSSVLENQVPVNAYNFTEKKVFGKPVTVTVTNGSARTVLLGETVFLNGWIGNVTEQDGIPAGERGTIDVNPNRHISTNQVNVASTFAVGLNPIFFVPQTDTVAGFFQAVTVTGAVSIKAEVIGSAPSATPAYIEIKPPYQNGDLQTV